MLETMNKIMDSTKRAYRESILIDNKIIEDELLSIMGDLKYLMNEVEENKIVNKSSTKSYTHSDMRTEVEEIERVHRRVPLWLNRPHQYNHKILVTFMRLSENNKKPVALEVLEQHSGVDDARKFMSHYNGMKMIAEKNHGKVFTEVDGFVSLWEPISSFVINQFKL